MTDEERPDGGEPGFDDPADAWVRDLLASARVTGPVPDDVAARLEATLASLRAERVGGAVDHEPETDEPAPVVPLRRRLAPLLAAAAALVVVAGGAVGVSRLGSDHGSQNSAAGSSSADNAEGGAAVPKTPLDQRSGGAAATALPRLSRAAFAQDAAAVMRTFSTDLRGQSAGGTAGATPGTTPAPTSADTSTTDSAQQPQAAEKGVAPPVTATPGAAALAAAVCPGPRPPRAVTVPATLDGAPVALVFRPPTATAQLVEAWSCDGTTLLASASVRR